MILTLGGLQHPFSQSLLEGINLLPPPPQICSFKACQRKYLCFLKPSSLEYFVKTGLGNDYNVQFSGSGWLYLDTSFFFKIKVLLTHYYTASHFIIISSCSESGCVYYKQVLLDEELSQLPRVFQCKSCENVICLGIYYIAWNIADEVDTSTFHNIIFFT